MCTSLYCSQVFKTTSNVLNSDVTIVNVVLITFCLLPGGDKVGSLADVEFKVAKYNYTRTLKKLKQTTCNCSKLSASDPHESKDGEMQDAKTFNMSCNIVLLLVLGRCFTFFTLRDQLVMKKSLLQVEESCKK